MPYAVTWVKISEWAVLICYGDAETTGRRSGKNGSRISRLIKCKYYYSAVLTTNARDDSYDEKVIFFPSSL